MGGGGSCSLSFKVLLGAVATVMFVLLLLVGALESGSATRMTTRTQTVLDSTDHDDLKHHEELIGREKKLVYDPELDLNFVMNKRKVPNGPDPIHNRRAGNSKRPPGRA